MKVVNHLVYVWSETIPCGFKASTTAPWPWHLWTPNMVTQLYPHPQLMKVANHPVYVYIFGIDFKAIS